MIPKPEKRPPKPRKRIARTGKPKTRATKHRSLVKACDKLWGELVRAKGVCVIQWFDCSHQCGGPLQAMHGLSRRYHGTRWDIANGFCGCRSGHMRYTKEPMAWTRWLIERWGLVGYDAMWAKAQAGKPKDMNAVLAALQARKGLAE
jgi:hypothetical protein